MISIDDVSVEFGDIQAISEVDLRVEEGEFVTIVGPSGCGKTTLLRTIGGLQEPSMGTVTVQGREPDAARQAADIGWVFQEHTLLPWKSAMENVVFLRKMAGKPADRERAGSLLRTLGLDGFEDARPGELSGGMRQRVAIARALHLDASVLLMDEPFGELDELTRESIGAEIRGVWRDEQKTVVFVTHSVPEAVFLGDRCVVMQGDPGSITEVFDIDLPRPREPSAYSAEAFQEQVASVRSELQPAVADPEHPSRR